MTEDIKINKKAHFKKDATYNSIHRYFQKHNPKSGVCSDCKEKKKTQWANTSGIYTRDINDYRELCSTCHHKVDKIAENLGSYVSRGKNNPSWIGGEKKYNCLECNKSFYKYASKTVSSNVFCSKPCYFAYRLKQSFKI